MSVPVSVIIPIYNVEEYLKECLDSVIVQSLENLEIICVNDCSTDKSLQILNSYAENDSRIRIINHEKNSGQAAARNSGFDKATGEYVYYLDPDDLLFSSESIMHLYTIARKSNADEVIGATLRWYEQSEERLYEYHKDYLKNSLDEVLFQDHQYLRHSAIACNKLIKRSFLIENHIRFNSTLRKFEDNVYSWMIHLQAKSISMTLQATYLHRIRSNEENKSVMQKKGKDVYYHTLAATDLLDFFDRMPKASSLRPLFDRYIFSWCFIDVQELNMQERVTEEQKKELFELYLPVLLRIPETSLAGKIMPKRYLEAASLLKKKKFADLWEVFAAENYHAFCLRKKLKNVYSSMSWKVTSPLRKVNKLFK